MNNLLKTQNIDTQLQSRIKNYIQYITKEEKDMNDSEISLAISKLSRNLQEELQQQIKGRVLS